MIISLKKVFYMFIFLLILSVAFFAFTSTYNASIAVPNITYFGEQPNERNALRVEFNNTNSGNNYVYELINMTTNMKNSVAGSAKYYVYQNLKDNTNYKIKLRLCSKESNSYSCSNWVNAINSIGTPESPPTNVTLNTPTINSLTSTNSSVTINYKTSGTLNGVEIYNTNDNKTTRTTNRTGFTITGLKPNTTYKFKIRSYYKTNDFAYSSYSNVQTIKTKNQVYTIVYKKNGGKGTMSSQTVTVGNKVKLKPNKFKRSGYKFMGWATYAKRNDVNMSRFQIGKVVYKNNSTVKNLVKKGKVELYAVWKGRGPAAACDWAVLIANDNSFAYGTGSRAHHYGCYYCGTNVTGKKHAPKGSRWEKTYCCNPFVHAAYSHGTSHKKMLKYCKGGSGGGMSYSSWTRFNTSDGKFKPMGVLSLKNLKKGDILINSHHVRLYIGNNKIAEAGSSGWGADSIRVKTISSNNYKVLRPYDFK